MGKAADATFAAIPDAQLGEGRPSIPCAGDRSPELFSLYEAPAETTPACGYPAGGKSVRLSSWASGEWLPTTRLEVQYTAEASDLATGTLAQREKSLWGMSL